MTNKWLNDQGLISVKELWVNIPLLPGYGPVLSVNRPVRTRMAGGVGAGGEKPSATRLCDFIKLQLYLSRLFKLFLSKVSQSRN